MANNGYVQIPPDSTGKKIAHVVLIELDYDTGTIDFALGDIVVGASSGVEGTIVRISGTTSSGELYLSLDYESSVAFTVGENLQVNSVTYAKAASAGTTIYTPSISIVDHENPFNGVNVTNQGELLMTPAESPFTFEAFGSQRSKGENTIGLYHFNYGVDWGQLHISTGSNGGQVTSGSYWSGVHLINPVDSGSISTLTSHLYHPYVAGVGQTWIGSVALGDTGKDNVIRQWGYFDIKDGLFFELSGSTMYVVIRNSSTGTVVETKVAQTSWNVDRVDGSGGERNISRANLDVSKGTVYFIDFQWLGVGRVRFGMIWSGRRVVVHQFEHNAELDYPYMARPSLPATLNQKNVDTAGSISEMKCFSMAVIQSTNKEQIYVDDARTNLAELTTTINWTGSFRPIISVRPKQYFLGKDNRSITIPLELSLYSENAPIQFQVQKWAVLTGDTWSVPTSSYGTLEGDFTATTASFGTPIYGDMVPAGQCYRHDFPIDSFDKSYKIFRKARLSDGSCGMTVMAKLLNHNVATSSAVSINFNWLTVL